MRRSKQVGVAALTITAVLALMAPGTARAEGREAVPEASASSGSEVLSSAGEVLSSAGEVLLPAAAVVVPPTGPVAGEDEVRLVVELEGGSLADLDAATGDDAEVSAVFGTDRAVVTVAAEDAGGLHEQLATAGVPIVELDPLVTAAREPTESMWPSQNGFPLVGLPGAWDVTTGDDTIIAIVDTGVTPVSELAGRLLPGWDFVDNDADAKDVNGHGTQAATVAAGAADNGIAAAGACWSCRILPVRVLDGNGSGTASAVAQGINWAVAQGADVISLSLGTNAVSATMDSAVAAARAAGAVVVAAAGNSGSTVPSYPGAHPDAIGVAAVTAGGLFFDYSNRGAWVDVAAPGLNVSQTMHGTTSLFNGTSSATPVVAGIAALALASGPERTADEIVSLITSSGPVMSGIGGPLVDARRVAFVPGPPELSTLTPARILDTRGMATVDGWRPWVGLVPAGATVELPVSGRAGVPGWADSVVLNVTVTEARDVGFVTVWPCGTARPNASNLNFLPGQTVPNLVLSELGNGKVCLFTAGTTHLFADVAAYLPAGATFGSPAPTRLLDSRGVASPDGQVPRAGIVAAGQTVELPVAGRAGVPLDAGSVVLNVTAVNAESNGYVTVFPCGSPLPHASNLNFVPGQTVPNLVVSQIGANGKVCLYSAGTSHLLADLAAWFPGGADFVAASPVRLLDTRPAPTIDGAFSAAGRLAAGTHIVLPVAGRGGVPQDATSVALNVTVTSPGSNGYVTVWPCSSGLPLASNLNFTPGQTVPNLVMAPLSPNGSVCLFTASSTELVVDVAGWFRAS